MKYIQLLLFPVLLFIYSFVMDKNAQGFQDLVAIIYGALGVIGSVVTLILAHLLRKYDWINKWYVRIALGFVSVVISFFLLIIYSRING